MLNGRDVVHLLLVACMNVFAHDVLSLNYWVSIRSLGKQREEAHLQRKVLFVRLFTGAVFGVAGVLRSPVVICGFVPLCRCCLRE